MANNRANIRAALKNLLNEETTAGENVYSSRGTRYWKSELPAICIFSSQEPAQPANLQGTRYNRTLELTIEVRVEAGTDADDEVDSLLAEVEALIQEDPSIGGTVQSTILTSTEIRVDSEGEKDMGVGILTYECKYSA
jgi:hypothetical protein